MVTRRECALTFCCELIATVLLRRLGVRPKALWTCSGVVGLFTRMQTAWPKLNLVLGSASHLQSSDGCNRAAG